MIRDEIVEQTRHAREEYARRFNFDLRAMYRDLKQREGSGGHRVVDLARGDDTSSPHSLRADG